MPKTAGRRDFFKQIINGSLPVGDVRAPQAAVRNSSLTAEQEASRFLAQATLGADRTLIQQVASLGFENWIDQQFNVPQSQIYNYIVTHLYDESIIGSKDDQAPRRLFRYALWDMIKSGADLLRQRIALALSEIFVISTEKDDIWGVAHGVGIWYDMLLEHAFGNFRDLLNDVTYSPIMGNYLNHAGNRKTDVSKNRFPDENYARELMQLFTIGLFQLNQDGTQQLNGSSEPISTYTNEDITEFAKIFTGITYDFAGDPHVWWTPTFESGWLNSYTARSPMTMWESEHEPGSKTLLNGYVVPAGQTGSQDVTDALDHLFNHQNVGPFIGRQLIQRLVKSNPTPAYVSRVAAAFNNNGSGVRGDMKAVIKAILLDSEARSTSFITDPQHGKLREPFFRFAQMLRVFHYNNPQDKFWDGGWSAQDDLHQFMFNSPTVFNFFSPDYRPPGPAGSAGLVGPEFQLMNSYTSISHINFWYSRVEWGFVFNLPGPGQEIKGQTVTIDQPKPDWSYELTLLPDIDALLDHFDLILTYGTMSTDMRQIIKTAVSGFANAPGNHTLEDVIQFAAFLFMMCPEYSIQV